MRKLSDDSGGIVAEFAIVGVLTVLVLMVTVETGRALLTHNTLESVAEEAARCASIEWSAAEPPTRSCRDVATTQAYVVLRASQRGVTLPASAVAITKPAATADCGNVGSFVLVQIDLAFTPIIGVAGLDIIPLKGKACYPG